MGVHPAAAAVFPDARVRLESEPGRLDAERFQKIEQPRVAGGAKTAIRIDAPLSSVRTVETIAVLRTYPEEKSTTNESFQPWLLRPLGIALKYSMKPSWSRSPGPSIQASARSITGHRLRRVSTSPVVRA
jgi:hypothetical protein